ncbi:type III secretion protein T [Cupriavidus sp. YR651]|uniref:type III secretion system export apparatus subunit SctT n=1 Tax=Cupriavidus sp. YR651 TaxID=1855315 RepID=UPI00088ACAE4|nr:type III secretion system export apparatus subunit SctT [Cupriavidus sp. YR651]SDD38559.1 type III secretion protein T [Cupriavidus sp. YR651]
MIFDVHTWMLGAALGFARIAPIFFMLPFLNGSVLTGAGRNAVIVIVATGFWPAPSELVLALDTMEYVVAILREIVIGMLLGALLAWPFWVFHAAGNYIDNQRAATLSSTIDPVNGIETSELASFFNLFAAAIYLQGGGMLLMSRAIESSYHLCDPLGPCVFEMAPAVALLDEVVVKALIVSSPVGVMLMIVEFSLGLLSRFAPQLNAFAISLTVKSLVVVLILLVYFRPLFPDRIMALTGVVERMPLFFSAP